MVHSINTSQDINDPDSVVAIGGPQDLQDKSNQDKNIAVVLLRESSNYAKDSQSKAQQAQEYLKASDTLKKLAKAVRAKAQRLRQEKLSENEKEKLIKNITASLPDELSIFVPKDASPEVLEEIADKLEALANKNRTEADRLLKDSEESDRLSKNLKEQAEKINKKDLSLSDMQLRYASAHNKGVADILKKLGILNLDKQLKEQVALSQNKGASI